MWGETAMKKTYKAMCHFLRNFLRRFKPHVNISAIFSHELRFLCLLHCLKKSWHPNWYSALFSFIPLKLSGYPGRRKETKWNRTLSNRWSTGHTCKQVCVTSGVALPSKYICGVTFAFTKEDFLRGQVGIWISL